MTDRVKGFTVTLKDSVRIDDVEPIMNAIGMISGVAEVTTVIDNPSDEVNRAKVFYDFKVKFLKFIKEELK